MIVMGRLGLGCSGSSVVAEERLTSPPKTMAGYNYNKIMASAVSHERSGPMKRSKFSEAQIVYALRQAEAGTPVSDLCWQLGVSDATFYAWKKNYAHLGVSEPRRLRQLEEENSRLKRLMADLSLDKHMLSEVLRKKV
jgi:putative transposase